MAWSNLRKGRPCEASITSLHNKPCDINLACSRIATDQRDGRWVCKPHRMAKRIVWQKPIEPDKRSA